MLKIVIRMLVPVIAAMLYSISAIAVQAGEPTTFALLDFNLERFNKTVETRNYSEPVRMANACGLCTDVDCCGGSENGWKLCKADCPEGQYKCEQVSVCN